MLPAPTAPQSRQDSPARPMDTLLRRHGRRLIRLGLGTLILLILGGFIASLPRRYEQHATLTDPVIADPEAVRASLTRLGLSLADYAAVTLAFEVVVAVIFGAVALIIFWRRSGEPMALFVALFLVAFGTQTPVSAMGAAHPGHPLWDALTLLTPLLGWGLLMPFLFLFPDGRLVPRWGWLLLIAWAVELVCWSLPRTSPFHPNNWPFLLILIGVVGMVAGGVAAQIYRYRRHSTPIQRQQTKWVVIGVLALLLVATGTESSRLIEPGLAYLLAEGPFELLPFVFLPLTIGIAVLRYRLYDVDLLINRTLVYGTLTGLLLAVYLGSVVLLQAGFRAVTSQESALAVVISTLVSAVLFQPLRSRLQAFIDRRFYRRKYDAARTLAAFSAHLREEVDLTTLTDELVRVVEETMQPAHVSLWLRRPAATPFPKSRRLDV